MTKQISENLVAHPEYHTPSLYSSRHVKFQSEIQEAVCQQGELWEIFYFHGYKHVPIGVPAKPDLPCQVFFMNLLKQNWFPILDKWTRSADSFNQNMAGF